MWFKRDRSIEETGCTGTLVLHADGTDECEHGDWCGLEELVHDDVVACHELGCACTGETLPMVLAA